MSNNQATLPMGASQPYFNPTVSQPGINHVAQPTDGQAPHQNAIRFSNTVTGWPALRGSVAVEETRTPDASLPVIGGPATQTVTQLQGVDNLTNGSSPFPAHGEASGNASSR